MTLVYLLFIVFVFIFSFVLIFGAPYLPTLKKYRKEALDLMDLKPGQTLYELGCGDGSLTIEAAKRGWLVVGYEINPLMALISWLRTRRYRKQVTIVWGNFWQADLSQADGVFVFLLDRFMKRLEDKLIHAARGRQIKLVSYAFKIPRRNISKRSGPMFLYIFR